MMDNHAWYVCSRLKPYAKKKTEKKKKEKNSSLNFQKQKYIFNPYVRAWIVSIVYKYTFNRFSNECVMHLFCICHACCKNDALSKMHIQLNIEYINGHCPGDD